MIAKVEPLTTARALRGPFDYRLGESMEDVGVGSMLVVPFARRRILGVVVDVAEHSDLPPDKLAEPLSALEADVPAELVNLGLWVAHEYVSTPARGLALVLPPGTGTGSGRRIGPRRSLRASITAAGRAALEGDERLGSRQRAALEALAAGPARVSDLALATGCDHAGARRLEERGLVELELAEKAPARPRTSMVGARPDVRALTGAQEAALGQVVEAMDAPRGEDRRLLLHGVTGSGKTEVYLRAVAAALERGRTAIVLVPEIALTPQTAGRFVQRFGDTVAVLHSQLTARERYDEWARLRSGAASVCVGPRSAVFAPLTGVGLIVVDEEHDGSYKQDGDPRYDARAVAERRAGAADCVLLAGSATPRPESFERHRRLELAERVDAQPLPPVELVGMAGVSDALHPVTRDALAEVAAPGREGDGAAQPARLVELPDLRRVRPRVAVPRLRRVAGAAPLRRPRFVPPLRPQRAGAGPVPGLRFGVAAPPRPRHRAAGRRARARGRPAAGHAPGRRLGGRGGGGGHAGAVRGGALGRAGGHADGGEGP